MRTHFTDLQLSSVGSLPFVQREGEYAVAEKALSAIVLDGIDERYAQAELKGLRNILQKGKLDWKLYRGMCLGVGGSRVHTSLVAYALQEKLGHVYRVRIDGLSDFMCILHCWRYHGVTIAGLDEALSEYQLNDEVPFEHFKEAIDTMWHIAPSRERVVFQDAEGNPVSIYNTQASLETSTHDAINETIDLSTYETMCQHTITCMMELPKSVVLLGITDDECYVLDTTGRNESDIVSTFSDLVFPKRYFSRYIKFTGEVVKLDLNFTL